MKEEENWFWSGFVAGVVTVSILVLLGSLLVSAWWFQNETHTSCTYLVSDCEETEEPIIEAKQDTITKCEYEGKNYSCKTWKNGMLMEESHHSEIEVVLEEKECNLCADGCNTCCCDSQGNCTTTLMRCLTEKQLKEVKK